MKLSAKAVAVALILTAVSALAKDVPPPPPTFVHNEAVLSEPGAKAVSDRLARFEKETGHQMVVAAFQSLDGADLETYVNRLFRDWKIGDQKRNDGILFAMFLKDRKWRVEVGYGLEGSVTDMEAGRLATSLAVPYFKAGDYDGGVSSVVDGLVDRIVSPASSAQVPTATGRVVQDGELPTGIIVFLIIGLLSVIGAVCYVIFKSDDDLTIGIGTNHVKSVPIKPVSNPAYVPSRHKRPYVPPKYIPPTRRRSDPSPKSSWSSGSSSSSGFGSGGFSGGGGSSGGGGASGGW